MRRLAFALCLVLLAPVLAGCDSITAAATLAAALEDMPTAPAASAVCAATAEPTDAATVTATAPAPSERTLALVLYLDAGYVRDLTVLDGTVFQAGETFSKSWEFLNRGTEVWNHEVVLRHIAGHALGADEEVAVPRTEPGEMAEVAVPMVAPEAPGTYTSYWRLCAPGGCFGPQVYAQIRVAAEPAAQHVADLSTEGGAADPPEAP